MNGQSLLHIRSHSVCVSVCMCVGSLTVNNIQPKDLTGRSGDSKEVRGSQGGMQGGPKPQMEDDLNQNGR